MQWLSGFATFVVVSVLMSLGVEWALDAWWASDGLDTSSRPPLNAGGEWLVGGAIGLAAGWLVTRAFGED